MTRLLLSLAGIAALLVGVIAFGDLGPNLVYYLTPSEVVADGERLVDAGRRVRLAGTVEDGSVRSASDTTDFVVVEGTTRVEVEHVGAPPDLFQTGVPVVVEGTWDGETFRSDTMLIQHDETYYPPEDDERPAIDGGPES